MRVSCYQEAITLLKVMTKQASQDNRIWQGERWTKSELGLNQNEEEGMQPHFTTSASQRIMSRCTWKQKGIRKVFMVISLAPVMGFSFNLNNRDQAR